MTTSRFPHSDIHGSRFASNSPWHFGVRPVLLRLLAPRHPPCALPNFTIRTASDLLRIAASLQLLRRSRNYHYAHSIVPFVPCTARQLETLMVTLQLLRKCHCNTLKKLPIRNSYTYLVSVFTVGFDIQFPRYTPVCRSSSHDRVTWLTHFVTYNCVRSSFVRLVPCPARSSLTV
jgi:hypothetical protein